MKRSIIFLAIVFLGIAPVLAQEPEGIKKEDLEKAMEGHILAKAEMIGLYKKQ